MELHPMLDDDVVPNPGLWYVLSTLGDCPSARVGHSCSYVQGSVDGASGKLYIIGGANPSGPYCDTFVLDLKSLQWDTIDTSGFRARYEHTAFIPASQPNKVYVFGGADQAGNMNDIQCLDATTNVWNSVTVSGTPPSPRTYHTTVSVGDKLIVYSGGHTGPDPVGDRQVHCYDIVSSTWTTPVIKGDSPKPRHGHIMVAVGNKVFLHGGMAGSTFYDDLHVLDLDRMSWSDVKRKKVSPSARAAHGGAASGTDLFLFGGMNRDGALDDMFKLDTTTLIWSKVVLHGPPPACRLDFGMGVIELTRNVSSPNGKEEIEGAAKQVQEVLERELKPGSASSRDSRQDTGSENSSVGNDVQSESLEKCEGQEDGSPIEGATANPCMSPTAPSSGSKTLKLVLVHGGMDTEGEIFDDTLVMLVE